MEHGQPRPPHPPGIVQKKAKLRENKTASKLLDSGWTPPPPLGQCPKEIRFFSDGFSQSRNQNFISEIWTELLKFHLVLTLQSENESWYILWNIAWAYGISRGLRLYFIAYPDSSHNTDILNYNSTIDLPGDQY